MTYYFCIYQQRLNYKYKNLKQINFSNYNNLLIFKSSLQFFCKIYLIMMIKNYIFLILAIFSGHIFSSVVRCQQLPTIEHCGKIDKYQFIQRTQEYKPDYKITNSIQSMFPADSNLLIDGLLNNDKSKVAKSIKGNQYKYALNIAFISFFAILFVILTPILVFTRCCSIFQCLKKNRKQLYTNLQIRLPMICIVVLCAGLIICCAIVLNINREYGHKYNDYRCSINLIGDSLLQGITYRNPASLISQTQKQISKPQNKFIQKISFIGLNKLKQFINNLSKSVKDLHLYLRANLTTNSRYIGKINKKSSRFLDLTSILSEYNKRDLMDTFDYAVTANDRTQTLKTTNLKKNFIQLVQNISTVAQQIKQKIFYIGYTSDGVLKSLQNIQKQNLEEKINYHVQGSEVIKDKIRNILDFTDKSSLWQFNVGANVVIAFTILFVALLSFSVIYMVIKNNHDCRILIYICLLTLWIVGSLHFAVAIGFTLSNPAVHYSCQHFYQSFNSEQAYNKNILSRDPENSHLKIVGKCLTDSKTREYLRDLMINKELQQYLQVPRSLLSFNFDSESYINFLRGNLSNFYIPFQNFRKVKTIEVNDNETQFYELIQKVSKVNQCFPDSWIMSIHQNPPRFPCTLNESISTYQTCPYQQDFINRAPGCTGCMEMLSFANVYSEQRFYQLCKKRYDKCLKGEKNYQLSRQAILLQRVYRNVFGNRLKVPEIGLITDRMILAENDTYALLKDFSQYIQPVKKLVQSQPLFQNNQKWILESEADCRVLGKAIDRSVNILCSSAPSYVYNLRFLYLATSIIIMIICMLTILFVIRYEKQWQLSRKKQIQNQLNANNQVVLHTQTRFGRFSEVESKNKQKNSQEELPKSNKNIIKQQQRMDAKKFEQRYKFFKDKKKKFNVNKNSIGSDNEQLKTSQNRIKSQKQIQKQKNNQQYLVQQPNLIKHLQKKNQLQAIIEDNLIQKNPQINNSIQLELDSQEQKQDNKKQNTLSS